jgi:hypothetical protein
VEQPQPNRLQGRSCAGGVVDDVERGSGHHTDKKISLLRTK